MYTKEKILKVLSQVIDPDLNKDLVSLGMIQNVEVSESMVSFSLVLTTPACPLKNYLRDNCIDAIKKNISEELEIKINVTSRVSNKQTDVNVSENLKEVKNIIAVVSGKGGVGKSTIAVNLAVGLAMEGAKVGFIDGDIYGPSAPIMFGLEGADPEVVAKEDRQLIKPLIAHGVKVVSIGFFVSPEASLMWRGPMASNYLKQIIIDTDWGELDYLIFDMPPGTGDMHLTLVQTVPVAGVVVVSTPQKIALADAKKAISMFSDKKINVPILGLVENMSYFSPKELPNNKYYLFGKEGTKNLAEQMGHKLLGQIPIVEEVCNSGDIGEPIVKLNLSISNEILSFCKNTAQAVSIRNAFAPDSKIVETN